MSGHIYILHFEPAFSGRSHYVGFTTRTPQERLAEHLSGEGSRLTKQALAAGVKITLAFSQGGTPQDEQKWKRSNATARLCPLCRPAWLARKQANTTDSPARRLK